VIWRSIKLLWLATQVAIYFQLVSFPPSIYFGYFLSLILSIIFNNCLFANAPLKISQQLNHLHFNWIYEGHAAVRFWVLAAMRSRFAAAAHKCPNALQQCLTEWAALNTSRYALSAHCIVNMQMQVHIAYCISQKCPITLQQCLQPHWVSSPEHFSLRFKCISNGWYANASAYCILHIVQGSHRPAAAVPHLSLCSKCILHIAQVYQGPVAMEPFSHSANSSEHLSLNLTVLPDVNVKTHPYIASE